jgi:hypothetical protein
MTYPHLTTRSLAHISLLVSGAALVFTLTQGWSGPHTPVPTALAAAPKTALAGLLSNSDPASARAYYIAQRHEDLTTYTHPVYGFSFPYIKDFTVREIEDEQGEIVLVENPAVGMGFQIFITPDDAPEPLTLERIQHYLPDLPMEDVTEFTLPDDTPAVRFVSHDPVLGDVGETWFRRDGYIYQISVSAPGRELQDAWLREIALNLTFAPPPPVGG